MRTSAVSATRTACSSSIDPSVPDTVAFSTMPGQTQYVFDRMSGLPRACTDTDAWTAPRIAAVFAATFADLYPSFELRGIDWKARTAAALQARSPTNRTMPPCSRRSQGMLAGLERSACRARGEGGRRAAVPGIRRRPHALARARKRERRTGAGVEQQRRPGFRGEVARVDERGILRHRAARQGAPHPANERVLWGRVGDIGYINFKSIAGFTE